MFAAAAKFINNMEGAVHDIDVLIITPTPTAPPQSKPRKLTGSNTDPQVVITNFNGNAKPADTVEWLSPAPQHPIAAAPSPDDDVNGARCCQRRAKEWSCPG